MKQYLDLLRKTLNEGIETEDRTGVGTYSIFGPQIEFDLKDGFPLVTTKKVFVRGIIEELLWILSGNTNAKTLQNKNVHIWDEWAREDGSLGPVYGAQWRSIPKPHWPIDPRSLTRGYYTRGGRGISELSMQRPLEIEWVDQVRELVEGLKNNPSSRRHIVSSWNPDEIDEMALPPCHCFYQVYVRGEYLDLKLYQRSADLFLGVPFNIASYSLLLMMLAQVVGKRPGKFIHSFGNAHIYKNHIEQVKEQLSRTPHALPTMTINPEKKNIFSFTIDDFKLEGYESEPAIKAPVAV